MKGYTLGHGGSPEARLGLHLGRDVRLRGAMNYRSVQLSHQAELDTSDRQASRVDEWDGRIDLTDWEGRTAPYQAGEQVASEVSPQSLQVQEEAAVSGDLVILTSFVLTAAALRLADKLPASARRKVIPLILGIAGAGVLAACSPVIGTVSVDTQTSPPLQTQSAEMSPAPTPVDYPSPAVIASSTAAEAAATATAIRCPDTSWVLSAENSMVGGGYRFPTDKISVISTPLNEWSTEQKNIVDAAGVSIYGQLTSPAMSRWARDKQFVGVFVAKDCGYSALYANPATGNVLYATSADGQAMSQPDGLGMAVGAKEVPSPNLPGQPKVLVGGDRKVVWVNGETIMAVMDPVSEVWVIPPEFAAQVDPANIARGVGLPDQNVYQVSGNRLVESASQTTLGVWENSQWRGASVAEICTGKLPEGLSQTGIEPTKYMNGDVGWDIEIYWTGLPSSSSTVNFSEIGRDTAMESNLFCTVGADGRPLLLDVRMFHEFLNSGKFVSVTNGDKTQNWFEKLTLEEILRYIDGPDHLLTRQKLEITVQDISTFRELNPATWPPCDPQQTDDLMNMSCFNRAVRVIKDSPWVQNTLLVDEVSSGGSVDRISLFPSSVSLDISDIPNSDAIIQGLITIGKN